MLLRFLHQEGPAGANAQKVTVFSSEQGTIYRRNERAMLLFIAWIMGDNRNLAFFMVAILLIPVILMLL